MSETTQHGVLTLTAGGEESGIEEGIELRHPPFPFGGTDDQCEAWLKQIDELMGHALRTLYGEPIWDIKSARNDEWMRQRREGLTNE